VVQLTLNILHEPYIVTPLKLLSRDYILFICTIILGAIKEQFIQAGVLLDATVFSK